jgi:signal transduction histidine kinase/CheY-like chemotaxis protein
LALTAYAAVVSTAAAQPRPRVSLEVVGSRRAPNFSPNLEGEVVTVEGVVPARAVAYPLYAHLAIQDEFGYGLVLEGTASQFSGLQPGQRIEARGTVAKRGGLPVLLPTHIVVLSSGPVPTAKRVDAAALFSFRYQGVLVSTDGRVIEKGEAPGGEYLLIGDARRPMRLFLPVPRMRTGRASLDRFEIGDRVRVTGIAGQYCPFAPYDRYFEVVVGDDEDLVLVRKRWLVSPEWFAISLAFLVFALGVWWIRERRMAVQRHMVRTFYSLGEELIGFASPPALLNRLDAVLPGLLKISGAHLYLYHRGTKTLERVADSAFGVPVYPPEGGLPLGPAACFRNQALLTIRDTYRSPFFPDGRPERQPGAVVFVPMFSEADVLGVLELYDTRTDHEFNRDERALTQHLANQVGIALRLMEEKSIREQLYRSEKLAAVGQLVSGIAAELRTPLDHISRLAESVVLAPPGTAWNDIESISGEARRASEIVSRLVSFMQPDRAEAKRIELNSLLRSLIQFRQREWSARGFLIREMLSSGPVHILGSQGQLERVFLDLLVQAEHALSEEPEKTLTIATTVLARKVLVEIEHASAGFRAWEGGLARSDAGLHSEEISRGVVRSHGGDLRITGSAQGLSRIEIEFPLAPARLAEEAGGISRAFTCLVVDPDRPALEELVHALTRRGCRVIPAGAGEDATELVQRLHFDVVFCVVRLPGLNWIEFSESIRGHVGGFVLITEGYDYELSRGLLEADNYVLNRPFSEADLDRVLATVERRLAAPEARFQVLRPPADRKVGGNLG